MLLLLSSLLFVDDVMFLLERAHPVASEKASLTARPVRQDEADRGKQYRISLLDRTVTQAHDISNSFKYLKHYILGTYRTNSKFAPPYSPRPKNEA
jgi:hypothetical protein